MSEAQQQAAAQEADNGQKSTAGENLYGMSPKHDEPSKDSQESEEQKENEDSKESDDPKDSKEEQSSEGDKAEKDKDKTQEDDKAEDKDKDKDKEDDKDDDKEEVDFSSVKLPENSPLEESAVDEITAYAKEQGLNAEQAQSLLEFKHDSVVNAAKELFEEAAEKRAAWGEEIKADKELGGENFKEVSDTAQAFIKEFGSDELKAKLDESGLGNYPELVRMIYKAGKKLGMNKEKFEHGGPSEEDLSREKTLYPNLK